MITSNSFSGSFTDLIWTEILEICDLVTLEEKWNHFLNAGHGLEPLITYICSIQSVDLFIYKNKEIKGKNASPLWGIF